MTMCFILGFCLLPFFTTLHLPPTPPKKEHKIIRTRAMHVSELLLDETSQQCPHLGYTDHYPIEKMS